MNSKKLKKFEGILLRKIDNVEKIGEGTFGQVYKAKYTNDNGKSESIAIKKFIYFEKDNQGLSITTMREMKYLKMLDHPNIVKLREIIHSRPSKAESNKQKGSLYLIFDFLNFDLQGLMNNPKIKFELPHVKCIMHQIFQGMDYLHSQNIIHRDIKGANILVSSEGLVQIADFGLARHINPYDKKIMYTQKVVTLWFRSPELLLGMRNYTAAVDAWSLGCILAEIVLQKGKALFNGHKENIQIGLIYEMCGSPSEMDWEGVSKLRFWNELGPKQIYTRKLKEFLTTETQNQYPADLYDLIDRLLIINPNKRLTVKQALEHPFFTSEPKMAKLEELAQCFPKEDCHEFIMRNELHKRREHEYKKYYTFKHNLLQLQMLPRQDEPILQENPNPPPDTSHISDKALESLQTKLLMKIKVSEEKKAQQEKKEQIEIKEKRQRSRSSRDKIRKSRERRSPKRSYHKSQKSEGSSSGGYNPNQNYGGSGAAPEKSSKQYENTSRSSHRYTKAYNVRDYEHKDERRHRGDNYHNQNYDYSYHESRHYDERPNRSYRGNQSYRDEPPYRHQRDDGSDRDHRGDPRDRGYYGGDRRDHPGDRRDHLGDRGQRIPPHHGGHSNQQSSSINQFQYRSYQRDERNRGDHRLPPGEPKYQGFSKFAPRGGRGRGKY